MSFFNSILLTNVMIIATMIIFLIESWQFVLFKEI
jgi:hypothetical protein